MSKQLQSSRRNKLLLHPYTLAREQEKGSRSESNLLKTGRRRRETSKCVYFIPDPLMLSIQSIITQWPSLLVCICNWNAAHLDRAVHFKVEVLSLLHWDIPMHFNYHDVFLAAAPQPLNNKMVHHWPKEWVGGRERRKGGWVERGRIRIRRVNKDLLCLFLCIFLNPRSRDKDGYRHPSCCKKKSAYWLIPHTHAKAHKHHSCHNASALHLLFSSEIIL